MQHNFTKPNLIYIPNERTSTASEDMFLLVNLFILLAEGIEESLKTA